ncbi:parathyroid hormone-responsive B1 isoform 4 [Thecamonas trahens ATCC 50062]|uniref:Parathyroid hormone-responsive B1 isoform 4 n=1 Tax=Thecamonas trahens ATCC 50062 TaxID=461836 RepID=A0A0L0DRR9_THETB|nr:parathyroid hormone-responsive B1 isoform 4 [Thecamonas trahens ATCC 50062]KNC54990.1 parathyroid hormone-responsive B1 isoform 4 [Thecamonas trahens ATCC 50062]|eukprot:XP_013753435.1 parathyroid hormone-responsive B1 isoform 4 [Thecamonas trahens ATCC 50062]
MSLFQAREWWRVEQASHEGEEFSFDALCVAALNEGQVVTGSLSGMLRVYGPKSREYSSGHLLLEKALHAPVLAIEAGRFVRGSHALVLAVLHPKSLVIYALSRHGSSDLDAYYSLDEVYAHDLGRPAAAMTYGPFGGARGKDSIVVLTLDGQLAFFDQDAFAFAAFLPRFLLPGPLLYISLTDTLVVGTSEFSLEAYTYASLATKSASQQPGSKPAGDDGTSAGGGGDGASGGDDGDDLDAARGKRLVPSWTLNLGQPAVQLALARFSPSLSAAQSDVLVLGVSSLFCVSERGELRSERRLPLQPLCMYPYPVGPEKHNLLLASASGMLTVLSGESVVWATKVLEPAVALAVGTFGGLRGLIVTLSADGALTLSYLGTDPSLSVIPGASLPKDADFAAMEREMRKLNATVSKASVALAASAPATDGVSTGSEPVATAALPTIAVSAAFKLLPASASAEGSSSAVVELTLTPRNARKKARDIDVRLTYPPPFRASHTAFSLPVLAPGETYTYSLVVEADHGLLPSSMRVQVAISYVVGKRAEPRSAVSSFALPLALLGRAVAPIQASLHKYTLATPDADPLDVGRLYPLLYELAELEMPEYGSPAAGVLTFQLWASSASTLSADESFVTILVSNKEGKYRLVANNLRCWAWGKMPLAPLFKALDTRFATRKALQDLRASLASQSEQLRGIQKRLLTRFTARNPEPLNSLDTLFDAAYQQVLETGSQVENLARALRLATASVAALMRLLILLLRYSCSLPADQHQRLVSLLVPPPTEGVAALESNIEWEEMLDAGLRHFVSTSLASSLAQAQQGTISLAPLTSLDGIRTNIELLVTRLADGVSLQ